MKDGRLHWINRDLGGQTFGALTALHPERSDGRKMHWRFLCTCGTQCVKVGADVTKEVKRGGTPNCGCLSAYLVRKANATHGMSKHPAYAVWASMRARCGRPTHVAWRNYGGRGITVCAAWQNSFDAFWADMGPTYAPGLTLDRIDNSRGYSPSNCRWAGWKAQARNRRGAQPVDIQALSEETGIPRSTLYYRLRRGLPLTSSTTC